MNRRFGIEEEAMLVDAVTLRPTSAVAVRDALASEGVTPEFFTSQLEFATTPVRDPAEALAQLRRARARIEDAVVSVHDAGARPVVWRRGTPFDIDEPELSEAERYHEIAARIRGLDVGHQLNATHVHVEIDSREEGVRVLNRMRPWLPLLLALGANSPHWRGRDTGFASWRAVLLRRWPTTGCPPEFADATDYNRRVAALAASGAAPDAGMLGWFARLSTRFPTVEFRVFDAQCEAENAVRLAEACLALVDAEPVPAPPPEFLDAELWLAARDGMAAELWDPRSGTRRPTRELTAALSIGPAAIG